MPANQFFTDWVTGDIITADKLNTMKNEVQPYLGYTPVNKAGDTMTGPLKINNQRLLHVHVNQGNDTNTRYYYLGRMLDNNGILKINGILGNHFAFSGRRNIDLQFAFRNGFRADGYIMGTTGGADILVKDGGDGWAYAYLVTNQWSLVNLELSTAGNAEIHYNGTYSTIAPGGTTLYELSNDFANNTHPHTLKMRDGVLQVHYDHQNRFVVQSYLSNNITISGPSSIIIAITKISVPSGRSLYLRRVRWYFSNNNLRPRINGGFIWTGFSSIGDSQINGVFANFEPSAVYLEIVNNAPNNQTASSGNGIWAELEIGPS